jgi:serine phosphatase RsbU (regulator of sigma subunit)/anti-sigma regulatory factor (Ser/Thr protein kinase)
MTNWLRRLIPRLNHAPSSQEEDYSLPGFTISADWQSRVDELDIAPNDPLLAYLVSNATPVEIDKLNLESPALERLRANGVRLAVPLVSQGELIGMLNLGSRLSEQEYSSDDRRLLSSLATQAAPALRVAQLVRQQQAQARQRERLDQELRVARFIQQNLLPDKHPKLDGWHIDALWQPARAVSGDFYDFIHFPDGRLGIIVADVTDKGVPAALVMATTRSVVRSVAETLIMPSEVLTRANNLLCPEMPPKMFVTCLYAVLNPLTGHVVLANAGHNPPYHCTANGVVEARATGMPLGLLPEMQYDEKEVMMVPGDSMVFTSDGLTEAHNPEREMFGFARLKAMLNQQVSKGSLIECLMQGMTGFTGEGIEQEDDITLVTVQCLDLPEATSARSDWTMLGSFNTPTGQGNERLAAARVLELIEDIELPEAWQKRLETAVAEATMNAMEYGNLYDTSLAVRIDVRTKPGVLSVCIFDHGKSGAVPESTSPDLDAKLAGLQSPRGWGLYLIRNMVDEMHVSSDNEHNCVELIFNLEN